MWDLLDKVFVWTVTIFLAALTLYVYVADIRRRAVLTPEERRAEDDEMNI